MPMLKIILKILFSEKNTVSLKLLVKEEPELPRKDISIKSLITQIMILINIENISKLFHPLITLKSLDFI